MKIEIELITAESYMNPDTENDTQDGNVTLTVHKNNSGSISLEIEGQLFYLRDDEADFRRAMKAL